MTSHGVLFILGVAFLRLDFVESHPRPYRVPHGDILGARPKTQSTGPKDLVSKRSGTDRSRQGRSDRSKATSTELSLGAPVEPEVDSQPAECASEARWHWSSNGLQAAPTLHLWGDLRERRPPHLGARSVGPNNSTRRLELSGTSSALFGRTAWYVRCGSGGIRRLDATPRRFAWPPGLNASTLLLCWFSRLWHLYGQPDLGWDVGYPASPLVVLY